MEPLTYSWIGQCAAAPLVFLLSAWTVGVFHSYRRQWLSVDLFLLALAAEELLMALQVFIFSLLSLVRPEWDGACGALVWSLNATRALQLATLASLLADRALTCHWPYRYRFSVRRHQLRYHLGVLAAMAALLGVAALIARPQQPQGFPLCYTMPHLLHVRLALFLLAVYGALVLVTVLSAVVVQTSRGCTQPSSPPPERPVPRPRLSTITATATVNSTTSSSGGSSRPPMSTASSSTGGSRGRPLKTSASTASSASSSTVGLRAASSTADLLPTSSGDAGGGGCSRPSVLRHTSSTSSSSSASDFRWSSCASVGVLSCVLNHLPYLTLVVLGTFTPEYLPQWPGENISLWMSLAEGLLLPFLLLITDGPFRRGAKASCSRKTVTHNNLAGVEGPFRLFPKEEVKAFPLTNGSLFSSLLSLPVDNNSSSGSQPSPYFRKDSALALGMGLHHSEYRGLGLRKVGSNEPCSLRDQHYGAPYYCRDTAQSLASLGHVSHEPLYSDPTNKTSSMGSSSIKEDHIYATLSETFGSMSSFSDDLRCPSVTTVANDDFEFHDPRTSGNSSEYKPPPPPPSLHYISQSPKEADDNSGDQSLTSFTSSSGLIPFARRTLENSDAFNSPGLNSAYNENLHHQITDNLYNQLKYERRANKGDKHLLLVQQVDKKDQNYCGNEKSLRNSTNNVKYGKQGNQNSLAYSKDSLIRKNYRKRGAREVFSQRSKSCKDEQESKFDFNDNTLSRKHRISSLSMNDLDKIHKSNDENAEEEMMFLLPVKSESMLSLYRLYLAEDDEDSNANLKYSVEVSKSENDLSTVSEEQPESFSNSIPSSDEIYSQSSGHEIYQKRRRPQSSNSKVRRQHKILRAKGVNPKIKPQISSNHIISTSARCPMASDDHLPVGSDSVTNEGLSSCAGGVQVAIVDNRDGRQNGIITIRDPSGLSVQELFSVLNRARVSKRAEVAKSGTSQITNESLVTTLKVDEQNSPLSTSYEENSKPLGVTTIPVLHETNAILEQSKPSTEFKKIFVSEYI